MIYHTHTIITCSWRWRRNFMKTLSWKNTNKHTHKCLGVQLNEYETGPYSIQLSQNVVLLGTRFLRFWHKKVVPDGFRRFFTNFPNFCVERHGFVAFAALQRKFVRSPQKLGKFVKNRRNPSGTTFLCQKRRNLVPNNTTMNVYGKIIQIMSIDHGALLLQAAQILNWHIGEIAN